MSRLNRTALLIIFTIVLQACDSSTPPSNLVSQIKFLDDALRFASDDLSRGNHIIENKIERTVRLGGNRPPDMMVLEKVNGIRKETNEILTFIDGLRQEIITTTGGYVDSDPRRLYKGAGDIVLTSKIMIDGNRGAQLKNEVNQFIDNVNRILQKPGKFKPLALDVKDDPRLSLDVDINQDFVTYYFKNALMVQTMAKLSELEMEILRVEQAALQEQASEVGAQ